MVAGGEPANTIWVQLAVSESSMHLLTVVAPGISCSVNGNAVSKQYWVHSNDRIEIAGYVLNWAYINGDSNEAFINQPKKSSSRSMKMWIFILIGALALGAAFMFLTGGMSDGEKRNDAYKSEDDTIQVDPAVLELIEDVNDSEDAVLDKLVVKQVTTPAEQGKKGKVSEQGVETDVNVPVAESPVSADSENEPEDTPIVKHVDNPKVAVSSSMSVPELWDVLKDDDTNCLAQYRLAVYYYDNQDKIKATDNKSAKDFWDARRKDGDIQKYVNNKSLSNVRLAWVMLVRAKNNMPKDIDPSIKADILDRLRKIKEQNPEYNY